ncbi:unnamed protein product [Adineta steineri]|uniref:Uncharacterized protein n=3 Tax=Adineta steineri TaxID=433720 RepID=A0A818QGB2_9BILA|nr:unnamed protein product [Adineta steineri]
MATTNRINDNIHSNGSVSSNFKHINNWFASFKDGKLQSSLNHNPKLNAEIHSAITTEYSEYASTICDHLFSLYHDVQHRPFVLQFLPSFVIAYYDVLYHHNRRHHSESVDAMTKGVTDDGHNEKVHEFRIPNLTVPSIYHTPNPDHYAPTPLTQHAISKHETKCDVVRLQSFTPFDSVNGSTREQILWFLLIQYGINVCFMDKYSHQSYIQMSKKLLGQGFSFNGEIPVKSKSALPPTGRRIHVSSRIMSEMLGTLFYLQSNSSNKEAKECMRLLKERAEYEMYSDVILVTESMGYLHEFESQRPEKQDTMGIEIELPPTIDVIRQKRTATTTRSMKNRQHGARASDTTVLAENDIDANIKIIPASPQQRPILNVVDENTSRYDYQNFNSNNSNNKDIELSPVIDEARTHISSSIGPAISTPSPSSPRHYKPVSLTSTRTYFKTVHQQQQHGSSPTLQITTMAHNNDDVFEDKESLTVLPRPRTSSMRHGEKKEAIATVRFIGDTSDENGTNVEETYL